jgi:hypothetical protein
MVCDLFFSDLLKKRKDYSGIYFPAGLKNQLTFEINFMLHNEANIINDK